MTAQDEQNMAMVKMIAETHGRLDICVNSAGSPERKTKEQLESGVSDLSPCMTTRIVEQMGEADVSMTTRFFSSPPGPPGPVNMVSYHRPIGPIGLVTSETTP